jgi:membrane-associated protease RseP (regulator of RpoE activity)
VRLAVGTAAVVAIFLLAHLGALLFVLVAILVMVMLHELGHFATAKWSGMKVTEFFVGFGPRLWSIRRGETEYGIKAIPAGGYTKIPGMTNLEEIADEDEPRTYRQQPFYKRIIVASAGSFTHFLLAFLLAYGALLYFGNPSPAVKINSFVSWPGHAKNAAQEAGLRVGDVVEAVNGKRLTASNQLDQVVYRSPGKPLRLTVERDGRTMELTVVPARGHLQGNNETIGGGPGKTVGLVGISQGPVYVSEGPVRGVGTAGANLGRYTWATLTNLGHVFSPSGLGSLFSDVTNSQQAERAAKSDNRIESLVGAVNTATQAEQAGILYLIEVLIALNVVIGIVNMLPMLPLDGGHVAIAVYERIRTRRGRPYYQADAAKLLPVAYAFMAILAVIVLSAVYLDIAHPITNPFH